MLSASESSLGRCHVFLSYTAFKYISQVKGEQAAALSSGISSNLAQQQ